MIRIRYVLLGTLALAGCGQKKLQRTHEPAAAPTSAARATATPTGSTPADGTFTGQDILTRFGDVQVAITRKNGRITDVTAVKLPNDRPRSLFISQQAGPILRSEVLTAQSARINLISGATYTSDAWAQSVQSAVDQTG